MVALSKEELEIKFNQAVELEHGLNQEIGNRSDVIELYRQAFDSGKGVVRAGNYLARIYQKANDEEEAIKIYDVISKIDKDDDNFDAAAIGYARYRLNRIEETKLLHNLGVRSTTIDSFKNDYGEEEGQKKIDIINQSKLKKVIKEYDRILEINDIKDSNLETKIIYHRALANLKIAEYKIAKLSKEILAIDTKAENYKKRNARRKLVDEIKTFLELSHAREDLEKSAAMGYSKAKAELKNIEARLLFEEFHTEQVIQKIEKLNKDAFEIDPKNKNTKLISANLLSSKNESRAKQRDNDDQAFSLLREILQSEPKNPNALALRNKLSQKLASYVTDKILEDTLSYEKFIPKTADYGGFTNYMMGRKDLRPEMNERRSKYEKILKDLLIENLIKDNYFTEQDSFATSDKLIEKLSLYIDSAAHQKLKDAIISNSPFSENQFKEIILEAIDKRSKEKKSTHEIVLSEEDVKLNTKRMDFRNKIVNTFMEYHDGCRLSTSANPGVTLVKDNSWFKAFGFGAKYVIPIASGIGGTKAVSFGLAFTMFNDWMISIEEAKALKTAKKFAQIGYTADGEDHRSNAKAQFEYIANELMETYGMQIDQLKSGEINKCAEIAVKKMMHHLNNKLYNRLSAAELIDVEQRSYLLEGIIKGKLDSEKTRIDTLGEVQNWYVEDLFENTAITTDGDNIYCNYTSEPEKYGARYSSTRPRLPYKLKTDLKHKDKQNINKAFQKHLRLQEVNKVVKKENIEKQKFELEHVARKIGKAAIKDRLSFVRSVAETVIGGTGLVIAGILAEASYLGFQPIATASVAAILGVSAPVIVPVAIAVCATIGVGFCAVGLYRGYHSLKEIYKGSSSIIEDNKIVKNLSEEEKQKVKDKKMKKNARNFAHKVTKNAKYTTSIDSSKKENELVVPPESMSIMDIASVIIKGGETLPKPRQVNFKELVKKQMIANKIDTRRH